MSTAPMTVGQMKDLISAATQAIPTDLTFDQAAELLGKKRKLGNRIRAAFYEAEDVTVIESPPPCIQVTTATFQGFDIQLQQQAEFFKKYFGFKLDLSGVKIPDYKEGFDRLIVVPQQIAEPWKLGNGKAIVQPLNWLYSVCEKHFRCWRYNEDLGTAIPEHDRHPKDGTYAILVRDRQEADEENKNLSARYFREEKILTETLIEGILHELKYWDETKTHRDVKNWTLYPGSRDFGGGAPRSGLCGGGFSVGCYHCVSARDFLRARSVVS